MIKILLIGCSWTAGTKAQLQEKPAPAEFLDTDTYEVWNAALEGTSLNLHNYILPKLLDTVNPDHVFFQFTGVRRYTFAKSVYTDMDAIINDPDAWKSRYKNYYYLDYEHMKKFFHWLTPAVIDKYRKNVTDEQKRLNDVYKTFVTTDIFRDQYLSLAIRSKHILKNHSHTFIAPNRKLDWSSEHFSTEMESVVGEPIVKPYEVLDNIDDFVIDDGNHLNRSGAQKYCDIIYKPYLPDGA